jgi:uncharacterized RDD family membrane protein YckC
VPEPRRHDDPLEGAPPWFGEPSFGQRLLAAFVDGFVLLGVGWLVLLLPVTLGPARALTTAVGAGYYILTTALTGRTVGKRLLGIRVVDLGTGGLCGLRASAVRWAVPALPALVTFVSPAVGSYTAWFAFVVFLPVLKGPQHRGIHDLVAGTIVTRVNP